MFTTKGLFSNVVCPHLDSCLLPRCIFKHPDGQELLGESTHTEKSETEVNHEQDGPRKRQKIAAGDENAKFLVSGASIEKNGLNDSNTPTTSTAEKPPKKSLAATREISPPPLRRQSNSSKAASARVAQPAKKSSTNGNAVSSTPKPAAKKPVKAPLKVEGLNPRALKIPAPAPHDTRFKLLQLLHQQFVRLNTELSKDAKDTEEPLVLSDQALITKALDIEQDATLQAVIYANVVKNMIQRYRKMSVKQWVEEREKEVAKEKALEAAQLSSKPAAKSREPPKPIETGLSPEQELDILPRLYTPIHGLSKHGYVSVMPTEAEINSAKQGVEMAKGWEVCDRCKSRFQVFPERREEDGALTSGGKCTYHYGKPYFPKKSASDPKGTKREKRFRCCGQSMGESPGCTHAENHIFVVKEVKRLAAVLNFEKTPENPEKESTNPVCIDGEMGYTVYGLELIRLTATSWPSGEELFDVLVKPVGLILDLNSRFSGVYPQNIVDAQPYDPSVPEEKDPSKRQLRIVDSPAAARTLLFSHISPKTPIIGHGLENDLNSVRIIHSTIIDTALLYPHKAGLPYRNGLKWLMDFHLNRNIQMVVNGMMEGHDSKEDANAAGELVKFALANEWQKMKRDGWSLENGKVIVPGKKEGAATGILKADYLEGKAPLEISSDLVGRKRTRDEVDDAEEGEVKNA